MARAQAIEQGPPGGNTARELLSRLRASTGKANEPTHLLVIAFGELTLSIGHSEFFDQVERAMAAVVKANDADLFVLTPFDRAILARTSDYVATGIVSDLKIRVLQLIERMVPEYYGVIDQSRLFRMFDLSRRRDAAISVIEGYMVLAANKTDWQMAPQRGLLTTQHIQEVETLFERGGAAAFCRSLVTGQDMVLAPQDRAPEPVMTEFFVSMESLRNRLFPGVDITANTTLFKVLTLSLDRMVMRAFPHFGRAVRQSSINLNVETTKTREFETFLASKGGQPAASRLNFEFRVVDILENIQIFPAIAKRITQTGAMVTADFVRPEMLGILSFEKLHVRMVKILWEPGCGDVLRERRSEISALTRHEVAVAFCRVGDPEAVRLGQSLGVVLYQGYFIDGLLRSTADREEYILR